MRTALIAAIAALGATAWTATPALAQRWEHHHDDNGGDHGNRGGGGDDHRGRGDGGDHGNRGDGGQHWQQQQPQPQAHNDGGDNGRRRYLDDMVARQRNFIERRRDRGGDDGRHDDGQRNWQPPHDNNYAGGADRGGTWQGNNDRHDDGGHRDRGDWNGRRDGDRNWGDNRGNWNGGDRHDNDRRDWGRNDDRRGDGYRDSGRRYAWNNHGWYNGSRGFDRRWNNWRSVPRGGFFNRDYAYAFGRHFNRSYYWWSYGGRWHRPYVVGYILPYDLYWEPIPYDWYYWLPPPPYGCDYVMVDGDILLISLETRLIIDALIEADGYGDDYGYGRY